MNSHCTDQLAHSNSRSRFFQETNDQAVDTESLNYLNLLLFTVPFDNSQFSFFFFFPILVQSLFLLKTEFKPCLFLSRCYLMAQTLSVSPSFCSEVQPHVPGTIQVGNPPAGAWSHFDWHCLSTPKQPHNHFVTFMAPILLQRTFPFRETP